MATSDVVGTPARAGLWQVIRAASSPSRLAAAVGVHLHSLSDYELGKGLPHGPVLARLLRVLGVGILPT